MLYFFLKRLQLSTGSRNSATGFMTETQRDILLFGDDNEEREDSLQGRRQSEWQVISLKYFCLNSFNPHSQLIASQLLMCRF